jgi:hypothetical protein
MGCVLIKPKQRSIPLFTFDNKGIMVETGSQQTVPTAKYQKGSAAGGAFWVSDYDAGFEPSSAAKRHWIAILMQCFIA